MFETQGERNINYMLLMSVSSPSGLAEMSKNSLSEFLFSETRPDSELTDISSMKCFYHIPTCCLATSNVN